MRFVPCPFQHEKQRADERNRNQNREGSCAAAAAAAAATGGTLPKTDIQWIADNIKIIGISTYIEPKVTGEVLSRE